LARSKGSQLLLGLQLVQLQHRFEPASDHIKFDVTRRFEALEQLESVFLAPMLFAAFDLPQLPQLRLGLGIYGPPGVGKRRFSDQLSIRSATRDNGEEVLEGLGGSAATALVPNGLLVSEEMQLFYPSLALAWRLSPSLRLGLTLQAVVFWGDIELATGGIRPALNQIHLEDLFSPSAILGLQYSPHPNWELGLSLRPPVAIEAEGDVEIHLYNIPCPEGPCPEGPAPLGPYQADQELLLYDEEGVEDGVAMDLKLPLVFKLGLRYLSWHAEGEVAWDLEALYLYERSSSHRSIAPRFEAQRAELPLDAQGSTQSLEPIPNLKSLRRYRDVHGLRLGSSLRLGAGWRGRLGGSWERGASPERYTQLDFPGLERWSLAGGLGWRLGAWGWDLAYSYVGLLPREVKSSEVRLIDLASEPNPEEGPGWKVIGNGRFSGHYHILALSLSWRGEG